MERRASVHVAADAPVCRAGRSSAARRSNKRRALKNKLSCHPERSEAQAERSRRTPCHFESPATSRDISRRDWYRSSGRSLTVGLCGWARTCRTRLRGRFRVGKDLSHGFFFHRIALDAQDDQPQNNHCDDGDDSKDGHGKVKAQRGSLPLEGQSTTFVFESRHLLPEAYLYTATVTDVSVRVTGR
jgi:hypothetical protein